MWVDKVIFGIVVVLTIIIVWYSFSKKDDEHQKECRKFENEIYKLQKEKIVAVDKCYIDMKKEKYELIQKELQFCFNCSESDAEHYCNILNDTVMVKKFFSANTLNKRKTVLDESIKYYKKLPAHLKSGNADEIEQ